jgi:CDP-diacylglycerol---serine O-phosphatidyltransferase
MDPIVRELEEETRRRRKRRMFDHERIPVRMMVPNFVTLLGLCWGLTSIRMSIDGRWELALGAIVLAAMLDGIDGRVARYLKASSRFGAELDSLADFVNFGVAPAILMFTWGFGDIKSLGWIAALLFALASALRLARFNVAADEEKPKWQSNYFTGVPTPAAAIVVLLPLYLEQIGFDLRGNRITLHLMVLYTVVMASLMVSTLPTYSGKLMGERIGREWVLPMLVVGIAAVACLVTYPYETLLIATVAYLAMIPLSLSRFSHLENKGDSSPAMGTTVGAPPPMVAPVAPPSPPPSGAPTAVDSAQIIGFKPGDQKR